MSFCYSHDEERFHGEFDSKEAAIAKAFEELDPDDACIADMTVFIGEIDQKTAADYLCKFGVQNMLEDMVEQASDHCGEVADGWLHFPCPALVERNGETKLAYHAKDWPKEKVEQKQKEWEAHDTALQKLTSKIQELVDEWAAETENQPTFWGVKNVKQYYQNGNCAGS